jgi:UDP-glucose 4-epimerase
MNSSPIPPGRLLISGVAGLIGSRLAHELLAAGWQVVGLDDFCGGWQERLPDHPNFRFERLDLTEPGALREFLAAESQTAQPFEAFVHLAARVGVRSVLRDPEGCRDSNLAGVGAVVEALDALPENLRPRVYAASTSEVYREARRPLSESDATRATTGEGRWAYAGSKLRGEELLDEAAATWGNCAGPVHLRFFNVVGPGQDAASGMVLANFVEQALAGEDIRVHGDGTQMRTFAHVDEVAKSFSELITARNCPAGPLNLGGVALTSIGELAACVLRLTESTSGILNTNPLEDCGSNFEPIHYREPDLARLASLGVHLPVRNLEAIVRDTLQRHALLSRPGQRHGRSAVCVSPAS